jgi:alkaline phosphatase D
MPRPFAASAASASGTATAGVSGDGLPAGGGLRFVHGVASFDPLEDAVLVWTRVSLGDGAPSGSVVEVSWFLAEVEGTATATVVAQGIATAGPDDDWCVTVDVRGLRPATTYHYWFESRGVTSPVGRTRTLPAGPTAWARLAVTCCADRSQGSLPTYRAIADDEVDLVLHLGDYVYEDPKGPYPVEPEGVISSLSDYRVRHAHTRLDVDLQALHRRHPVVFVWDDHDVADNAWRHGAKAHDPKAHGSWEQRLAAAARARHEWLPARLVDPEDLLSMRRSFALGDLVEVVVLDTRIPGRDQQAGDPAARPIDDPDRALLDPAQRRWAHERVRDRSRPWTVVASAVTVSELELPVPAGAAIDPAMPSGYQVVDGAALCTDEWDGYPAERAALCEAIAERGPGVVVVSGDVHSNWATYLRADADAPVVAAEMVCTAVSSTPMGDQLPPGWRKAAERVADGVPLQVWHDLEHHGYLRVDVRPDEVRGDWVAVDDDRGRREVEVLASWSVDRSWPPRWAPAVPSSPVGAFDDVVRPGLPARSLDGPDIGTAAPRQPRSRGVERVGAALAALAVVGGALWWVRRRRASPRAGGRALGR